jgi:hypothetical protein
MIIEHTGVSCALMRPLIVETPAAGGRSQGAMCSAILGGHGPCYDTPLSGFEAVTP